MKSLKRVALLLVSVLAVGLFAGCGGSFDASAYVKALMDNSYKNDSKAFVDMKIGSAEEASSLYQQGVDAEVSALLSGVSVSDDVKAAYSDFVTELLSKANYTVGEAEKNGDGFIVTVTYKQMKIFEPAVTEYSAQLESEMAEWQAQITEGSMTQDDAYNEMFQLLVDVLSDTLANVEYGEEQTATVAVDLINNVYTPSDSDFLNLESSMFDVDALGNLGA